MKLLLIGWDAADWSLIRPMLDRGMMPRFQQFSSPALCGDLAPVRPLDAAALWTSLATGMRATGHGVLNGVEVDSSGTRIRPASRWTLTATPIWSLLGEAGYRTHALGWPASHPAGSIPGVCVSDLFAALGSDDSVHPPRLRETLLGLRLTPLDIDAASLLTLAPPAGQLNPIGDQRLYAIAQFLAETGSLHAAATWALEHEPWDFAAVRYAGLARLIAVFGGAYAAAREEKKKDDAELFGELIPNAYRFYDMLLGRLLDLAGPDASVLLVSPTGCSLASPADKPHRRRRPGIAVARGPAFENWDELPSSSICDVAPTVAALFGLPSEREFHGEAWPGARRRTGHGQFAPRPIEAPGDESKPSEDASPPPPATPTDDDSVAHLVALGYREPPDEFLRLAIAELNQERQWRLVEAWLDAGDCRRAARLLEDLAEIRPRCLPSDSSAGDDSRRVGEGSSPSRHEPQDSVPAPVRSSPRRGSSVVKYRLVLAEAYFHAGEYESCRQLILQLQADGVDTPLGRVGLAALDFMDAKFDSALTHLRRCEEMAGPSASVLEMVGRLYLGLHRRGDASRALDGAIALDSEFANSHATRATAYYLCGDFVGAEMTARKALEVNGQSHAARRQLGRALARQHRLDEAIKVLKEAVAADPEDGALAHEYLADALELRGDHVFAMHHRALSHQRRRVSRRSQFDVGWIGEEFME